MVEVLVSQYLLYTRCSLIEQPPTQVLTCGDFEKCLGPAGGTLTSKAYSLRKGEHLLFSLWDHVMLQQDILAEVRAY